MTSPNVARFNRQVLQAIAALYESHPRSCRLGLEDLAPTTGSGLATRDDAEYAGGTLKWLRDNGYVSGEYLPAVGELDDVQLTAYSWRLLQSTDTNLGIQPLGEAVKAAVTSGGREIEIVGARLVERLTNG